MTNGNATKSERIVVRMSATDRQLLLEAARVAHKSVGEFLLDAGMAAANQALADRTRFELDPEAWAEFRDQLDRPVAAEPRLRKLLIEPGLLD